MKLRKILICLVLSILSFGCQETLEITSFKFEATLNSGLSVDVTATITGTDITISVPAGVDVTSLIATFVSNGAVTISGVTQTSGVTENNFTNPVTYTVEDSDGNKEYYTVTVTVGAVVDTSAPTSASISINSGNASTVAKRVTLTLSATDDIGVTAYYASETNTTPGADDSGWVDVTASATYSANDVSFSLSTGAGTKTVYVWFKDAAGNISTSATATISRQLFSEVSAGALSTCGRMNDQTVKCWGFNSYGSLGNGTTITSSTPVTVTGISTATQIACGDYHCCALLSDNTIKCWGYNTNGQLGNGSTTTSNTPVSVSGITNATQISGGSRHTCAVLSDSTVRCWGRNESGQLGDNSTNDSSTDVQPSVTGAVQISAGSNQTCAVLDNDTISCWGNDTSGQLGNDASTDSSSTPVTVSGISNASKVETSHFSTCAILNNGAMKCWGANGFGQLGDGTYTQRETPVDVSGVSNATQVTGNDYNGSSPSVGFTCALLNDNKVSCWGENSLGLGDDSPTSSATPFSVGNLTTVADISAGSKHTCGVFDDGVAKCWGYNNKGQLGDGSTTDSETPVLVTDH